MAKEDKEKEIKPKNETKKKTTTKKTVKKAETNKEVKKTQTSTKKDSSKGTKTVSKKVVKKETVKKPETKTSQTKKEAPKEINTIKEEDIKKEVEVVEEKEEDNKKKLLIIILLLLFVCVFGISVTFGKDFFNDLSEQIIEVIGLNKPTAPVITGGSSEWAQERLIEVEKDSEAKDGLLYYEYCVRSEKSTKNCEWKKTETKKCKSNNNRKILCNI